MSSTKNEGLSEIGVQQSVLVKKEAGILFRDLDKNGRMDIYKDPCQPIEARIEDLLRQMTLEEKADTPFIIKCPMYPTIL